MNNEELSIISEKEFEIEYQEIKSKVIENKSPVDYPVAVVLGGQPGAGKSNIYDIYRKKSNNNIVELDCDKFREFHPNFEELHKIYGDNDAVYTNPFIFKVVDRLVDELSKEKYKKYNMIIESSLKSPHTAIENGTILTPRGYKVELAVMATPKEESWKGTIDRYNSQKEMGLQPRAVPKEFHDLVVSNISDSISQVYKSGLMSNILIYNRNKECLYDMSKTPKINPNNLLEKAINGVKKEFYYLIATPEEVAELEKSNIQFDKKANESGFIVRCDKKDKEAIEDVLGQSKGLSK